ncbi:MAG: ATP-binding protein [Myxococcales bacterium]|nr:ATP-binding protein [Myxococcales bacterium]
MARFVSMLKRYLAMPGGAADLDLPARRRHLLACLDRVDDAERRSALHALWAPRLDDWCRACAEALEPLDLQLEALRSALDVATSRSFHLDQSTGSPALDLEVVRLTPDVERIEPLSFSVEAYAEALQLAAGVKPTRLGEVALRLTEPEVVRWLLTLELLQSTGSGDPWHVWPELLDDLRSRRLRSWHWHAGEEHEPTPAVWAAYQRLAAQGVVTLGSDRGWQWLEVPFDAVAVLDELLQTPDTTFGVLATALLQDRTTHRLADLGVGKPTSAASAAGAAARHAQLVTHEVRNALVPAQQALDRLRSALAAPQPAASAHGYLDRIDRALGRIFEFAARQQEFAQFAAPGVDAFDPRRAIELAVATVRNGAGAPLDVVVADELPPVRGAQEQLEMVLVNLLRNALRAVADAGRVRLSARPSDARGLEVQVEDDGPGIAEGVAPFIFERGFSTLQGSDGLGLYLAREAVRSWGGELRYARAAGGGALFVVTLPAAGES